MTGRFWKGKGELPHTHKKILKKNKAVKKYIHPSKVTMAKADDSELIMKPETGKVK